MRTIESPASRVLVGFQVQLSFSQADLQVVIAFDSLFAIECGQMRLTIFCREAFVKLVLFVADFLNRQAKVLADRLVHVNDELTVIC